MPPPGVARVNCWLAQFSDKPCDGQLRKCHLIPHQLLCRELKIRKGEPTACERRTQRWV